MTSPSAVSLSSVGNEKSAAVWLNCLRSGEGSPDQQRFSFVAISSLLLTTFVEFIGKMTPWTTAENIDFSTPSPRVLVYENIVKLSSPKPGKQKFESAVVRKAMNLSEITIYPVNHEGNQFNRGRVEDRRLRLDRRWMLVDEGPLITQREYPVMAPSL